MENKPFVASWSGGKDSAMAYYRAIQSGMMPKKLLTMFQEDEEISKSHALPLKVIQAQADRLNVPLMIRGAGWEDYEMKFIDAMDECRLAGITHGVFGDIDLEGHLEWVQKTCAKSGIIPIHPLWQEPRRSILEELLEVGFEAVIVVINTRMMPRDYIGRTFTKELMDELETLGIDSCGENGEFHTVVIDGPIFSSRVPVKFGEVRENEEYVFLSVEL
ncbi:diphthine--ammonia ligase [Paenisporosarcina quisquiliarum]|uniref:Diphthine--ammonia ligase n=1 Tax=Paenisporosarcina quisquiliarum TaxID=365346 RepID=A0A9X3RCU6_9BACL|nr:diphthine--ammonia ligase [Paenisporosarcina quisquiliarum]MCZ8536821.1 diphthine--ammonia ligase [Paenisporosarcina quisquiliarum]